MYLGITFASVLFMILYAAPFLGLPEIIAGARLCLTEQILLFAMMAVPFDGLFFLFEKNKGSTFLTILESSGSGINLCRNSLFWHISWIFIL